jgi:hypothetical protein
MKAIYILYTLLIGLTANIPIKLIGVLKLGEILSILFVIVNFQKFLYCFRNYTSFKILTFLMSIWLFVGIASSLQFGTSAIGLQKGIANIIVIYACLSAFIILLHKDLNLVKYFLVGYGLGSIYFSPFSYDLEHVSKYNVLNFNTYDAVGTNVFDIYYSPILTPILLSIGFYTFRKPFVSAFILLIYGVAAIYWDAKSVGFIFIVSSIIILIKHIGIRITALRIKLIVIGGLLMIAPAVKFLIEKDMLGSTGADQIAGFLKNSKKFNPFLLVGRPDPMIGLIAFAEKPLTGHGFNQDGRKYILIAKIAGFIPKQFIFRHKNIIPSHSNYINSMVEGGFFSGFIWLYMYYIVYKAFVLAVRRKSSYETFYLICAFFYCSWNIFLSATLRLDIAHFIIFSIVYLKMNRK